MVPSLATQTGQKTGQKTTHQKASQQRAQRSFGKSTGNSRTGKPIIEISEVWKTYHLGGTSINALSGLTLTIHQGEFVIVMGPSGSGKSTAMNMIGCLDVPTQGSIHLDGHNISQLHESDLAQIRGRLVGFIFQKFNLIPTQTALENVMLPMIFQGLDREERLVRARDLLMRVGLDDRMDHRPSELSGGQQQRVAIARSLANDPKILLADEPTGNLDSKTGEQVMEFIEKLHKQEGKTIVLVTHDPRLVSYADTIYHILDGKVLKKEVRKHK